VWETRAAAEAAAEAARGIPAARAYFATFDEVLGLEHGEIVS
jgi:hypothetical protein